MEINKIQKERKLKLRDRNEKEKDEKEIKKSIVLSWDALFRNIKEPIKISTHSFVRKICTQIVSFAFSSTFL